MRTGRLKAWRTALDARADESDYIHKLQPDRDQLQHATKRVVGLAGQPSVPLLLLRGPKALSCIPCGKKFVFNNWCNLKATHFGGSPKGCPKLAL